MNIQKKGWIWWLQGPWRKMNTVVGDTLYYWEKYPTERAIKHCEYHAKQQEAGIVRHWVKYLLFWPLWKNSYRWACEWEAYKLGSGLTDEQARAVLGSYKYGWLRGP